ncbi:FeoA family protein [Methanohalophilus euhalobius]|jgi:ferrous iron transport protein A|uniref:Ferrous iron transport protein A n=1 Tax=Methanohalophilus euhalobius TaxID=51203 RepID=A0A314ZYG5_9EURY|nr:FeoA family protein [Methanohalophilus euhalobius]PQV43117.1 ferrous iron transport protein A [Methanohalophilus euhalobius]RNI09318.1 ferrous iron transport protein A [Methanohalophilus euhalobius]RSD34997.1 MAG: ferrous iron transport protein A [Methanohalophilus sp.]
MTSRIPLAMYPTGQTCRICDVCAGKGLKRRLMEMGLTPESIIQPLGCNRGSFLVLVNGTRYALGRGMANKIIVEPVYGEVSQFG